VSLSVRVRRGELLQVVGVELRKVRLPKAMLEKDSDRMLQLLLIVLVAVR